MFSYLLVGGTFDDKDGKKSGYVRKLSESLATLNPCGYVLNGGNYEMLKHALEHIEFYDVILWFPNVPNDKPKLIKDIKKIYPSKILVCSKNNIEDKYDFMSLIARALSIKANLFLEIHKKNDKIMAKLCDPLGNLFCNTGDIPEFASALIHRLSELRGFTRMRSICDDLRPHPPTSDESRFIKCSIQYAEIFHEMVHPENTSRFLGNISFRCEKGFPSFKIDNCIYVSPRNMDKRTITQDIFVPVYLTSTGLYYKGELKPSVDAPLQAILYNFYKNIRYMIHSHTYIQYIPFLSKIIPCGAIEEAYEIIKKYPDCDKDFLMINLKGHGSLAMSSSVEDLENIAYIKRDVPELP